MKRLAILTSGGDAPGMNAAIRALVRFGYADFDEIYAVMHGYDGLIDGKLTLLTPHIVSNILMLGGTILHSSRSERFRTPEGRKQAYETLMKFGITHLIAIGGNGTTAGLHQFSLEYDISTLALPSTIDNDTFGTDLTLGFSTAVNTIAESLDKVRTTSNSHERIFFVEVMGRLCGRLALEGGIAGGAEIILTPENLPTKEWVLAEINKILSQHEHSFIVVATEGKPMLLLHSLISELSQKPSILTLGHLQRGSSPIAIDRILAARFAKAAITLFQQGLSKKIIVIRDDKITHMDLYEIAGKTKVPDDELVSVEINLRLD